MKFLALVILNLLHYTEGRIGFKKDQSTDNVEFPPRLGRMPDGVPQGHLRPLGYQKRPESRIKEITEMPFPAEFFKEYVLKSLPIVIRGGVGDVPAMTNWEKDDYLKKKYGDLDVHVVVKKELLKSGPKKMKFRKFLKEYQYEDWYMTNIVPHEMTGELILPNCLKCGIEHHLLESEMWMSAGGTSSLLHSHAEHNLHCLLAGRKDFIVINPKHKEKLAWVEKKPHIGAGYSTLDVDRINMFKNKAVSQVPWSWSTLKPGDCIFIPSGYLHQVRSFGRSFSSTILWSPVVDAHFDDCDLEDVTSVTPLADVEFMWTYRNGDRQLRDTDVNARTMQHLLLLLMGNETSLRKDVFVDFYQEIMSEINDYEDVNSVWTIIDPKDEGAVTKDETLELNESQLESLARVINYPNTSKKLKDEL